MKPLVAWIQPRPSAGAARTDVRVSTGGSGAAAGIGGFKWEAAIVRRPRLTIQLISPTLDGRTQLGRGDLVLNLNRIRQVSGIQSYYWLGAPITLYDASALDLATAPIEFTGYVRTTSYDLTTDQLTLNFEVDTSALDRPVLFNEFSGAGGITGDAALRGTPLPAGFGSVANVEPVWFDTTDNIGMIDGYANCISITSLFEGGNDFGAKVADYADFATLKARILDHTVAPGRWATCAAQGLVGLGAPPVKPITVDATFGTNLPGALIKRLLNTHAGIAFGNIDTAALDALDATVSYLVHYWTDQQRTVRDLAEAIAASCNATLLGTFQGKYSVTRAFGGAIAARINRQAPTSAARVTKWNALDPDLPTWRMRARAARPGTTLTIDQLNYTDTLIDLGVFADEETYRQGDLVWGHDNAQYLYINAVPASGHGLPAYPATSNAYWQQTKPPPTAADLTYLDGTPIEYLKPGGTDADQTVPNQVIVAGSGTIQVDCDYLGAPKAGVLPITVIPTVLKGGVNVRTADITHFTVVGINCTVTINNTDGDTHKGFAAVTALGGSVSYVDITATVDGYAQPAVRTTLVKSPDDYPAPPPSTTPTQVKITDYTSVTSEVYDTTPEGGPMTVKTGATGVLTFNAPLNFLRSGTVDGSSAADGKWQYRLVGGTWADVAAEIASSSTADTVTS